MSFTEIADRVWLARRERSGVNVTVVAGDRGLVVIDTDGSTAAARVLVDDVRRLAAGARRDAGAGQVVAVVNTHWHAEHSFGNEAFREAWPEAPIHAHEGAREELEAGAARVQQRYAADPADPHGADVLATRVTLPDRTFSSVRVLDLGDRALELLHPGRAHTGGDLVVRVPDADVLVAGDLVAESAPPSFGEDSWPMEWPLALDVVLGLTTPGTVVVPGHGAPVDRDFVEEQRNTIGIVAETVRDLAARGVPVAEALDAAAEWPWPPEHLATAVQRAYAHLPRSQKRLPLV